MTKRGSLRRALRVQPGPMVNLERFEPGESHGYGVDAAGTDGLRVS